MKSILLILTAMSTFTFGAQYSWQERTVQSGQNIFYINYDRPEYNEINEYKKYSSDLGKDYTIQRERETNLVKR